MTNQTLKNPTATAYPAPVDLDAAIEALRLGMAGISWLEKSFGRARMIARNSPDKKTAIKEPMVYQGGGEYYPCLPNDALKSYSFFRVNGSRQLMDYAQSSPGLYASAPVDLIVWANLKQINPAKDYIFTEELIRETLMKINTFSEVLSITRVWDDKAEDIFSGYTIDERQRELLMYPYQGFRIEMVLQFSVMCLQDGIFDQSFDETFD